jgi:hypothetical protein
MTTYVTTVGIQISGRIIPPRTALEHTDSRIDALGSKEVKRLIAQGYLKVKGIARNTEPGKPLIQHEPLPTTIKTNVDGSKIRSVEYGDPEMGGRKVDLSLPVQTAPVDRDPSSRPAPPKPKRTRKPKAEAQPKGKWDLDPSRLADLDLETLNALVVDIEPDHAGFAEGEEQAARDLLSSNFGQQAPPERGLRVEGDIDVAGKDKGRRSTKREPKTKRQPMVRKGA